MDEGTLAFIVDNKYLGVAFRGLKGRKLHPIVSAVWGHCEITMKYIGGLDRKQIIRRIVIVKLYKSFECQIFFPSFSIRLLIHLYRAYCCILFLKLDFRFSSAAEPLPLMDLCRRVIRQRIGKEGKDILEEKINELNLPQTMKTYLMFRDSRR